MVSRHRSVVADVEFKLQRCFVFCDSTGGVLGELQASLCNPQLHQLHSCLIMRMAANILASPAKQLIESMGKRELSVIRAVKARQMKSKETLSDRSRSCL